MIRVNGSFQLNGSSFKPPTAIINLEMSSTYTHDSCQRVFDTQEDLDYHVANPLEDPVCRVNEGIYWIKGFNCESNCGPS
jgi:hypothetical protein